MFRYQKANGWLAAFDTFSSAMYTEGEFELHGYLPFLLVPFHPLCREAAGKRVERDSSDWDVGKPQMPSIQVLTHMTLESATHPC